MKSPSTTAIHFGLLNHRDMRGTENFISSPCLSCLCGHLPLRGARCYSCSEPLKSKPLALGRGSSGTPSGAPPSWGTIRSPDFSSALRAFSTTLFRSLWVQRPSEEHTSELQSLMRISYAVFCLKKKTQ